MLKNRFAVVVVILALLVALAPAPSQAAPRGWNVASVPAVSSLFDKVARWWNQTLNSPDRPARRQAPAPKIGCGIDPNGQAVCGPGPDPDPLVAPEPGDPKG
jgi:hypothetical protein